MRKIGLFVIGGSMLFASVALVEGQQQGKGKGQFGGGGFGMANIAANPLAMIANPQIKKELEITDEQMEKIPAEVMVAFGKVLNEKQYTRFKQIQLQLKGNNAFKDVTVQKALNLTDDQKKNLTSIVDDAAKELAEIKGGFGGFGKGGANKENAEKRDTINKETKEKIYTVLTKEQRKTWREMIGEDFKLETPAFGGFNKKKTDNE